VFAIALTAAVYPVIHSRRLETVEVLRTTWRGTGPAPRVDPAQSTALKPSPTYAPAGPLVRWLRCSLS